MQLLYLASVYKCTSPYFESSVLYEVNVRLPDVGVMVDPVQIGVSRKVYINLTIDVFGTGAFHFK